MSAGGPGDDRVRLAELVAALPVATDLGKGFPQEHAQRACLVGQRLAEPAGLPAEDRHTTYYCSLLRFVGCTATAHEFAAVFGDDIAGSSWFAMADPDDASAVLGIIFRNAGKGQPARARARAVGRVLARGRPVRQEHEQASCEVARLLAERLGLGPEVAGALGQVFERWDGKGGVPGKESREQIVLPVRVGHLAHYGVLFHRAEGVEGAVAMARERSGTMFDPALADLFCAHAGELFADLPESGMFAAVVAAEPEPWRWLAGERVDRALRAMGDFADLKSPFTVGHSDGVARLAAGAARARGLDEAQVTALRRAGWLHDLGRRKVSTAIWDKAGAVPRGGRACRGRRPPGAAGAAAPPAGAVCGGGGRRAVRGGQRGPARPPRRRRRPGGRRVGGTGRAAPTRPAPRGVERARGRGPGPAGQGADQRPGGRRPVHLAQDVGAHAEHIYRKIGVSTRAAATAFALGHDLVQIG